MRASFEEELKQILKPNEIILKFYRSKNKNSAYVIILRDEQEFISFRLSNHYAKSFYSNRTFDSKKKSEELLIEIRTYMDKSDWYHFKYQDYFVLKALSQIPFNRIQYYIDNTMDIFDNSIGGLVFYQSRTFGRNYKEFNIVSESLQKVLRKLFAVGFINYYRKEKNEILIYISKSGFFMMDYMKDKYQVLFEEDANNINYKYLEVPSH